MEVEDDNNLQVPEPARPAQQNQIRPPVPPVSSLLSGFSAYLLMSLLVPLALISHSLSSNRNQFYPAVASLSSSKPLALSLANLLLLQMFLTYTYATKVFVTPPPTALERSAVSTSLRFALTETLISLTMFREEVGLRMCLGVCLLLVGKGLHLTLKARGENLDVLQEQHDTNGETRRALQDARDRARRAAAAAAAAEEAAAAAANNNDNDNDDNNNDDSAGVLRHRGQAPFAAVRPRTVPPSAAAAAAAAAAAEAAMQYPSLPPLPLGPSKSRLLLLSVLLLSLDIAALRLCVKSLILNGASVDLLFAFECAILAIGALQEGIGVGIRIRAAVNANAIANANAVAQRRGGPRAGGFAQQQQQQAPTIGANQLQRRADFEAVVAILFDALRFGCYVLFFAILFTYYGLPLNIVRDLYMCWNRLRQKVGQWITYRRVSRDMERLFPKATDVEVHGCGMTCIICREEMQGLPTEPVVADPAAAAAADAGGGGPVPRRPPPPAAASAAASAVSASCGRKLPCGHIFHFACLRQWLVVQTTCPTCRADIAVEQQTMAPDLRGGGGEGKSDSRRRRR